VGQFVKVGAKADFENSDQGKLIEAGGNSIAIFKVGEAFYAIENTCTHRGGPLAEGTLDGAVVTCPWHGAQFDVKTGAVLGPPAPRGVKSFPVRLAGDSVEVEVG